VVQRQETREWHDTLTLDELWFYFSIEHGRIWLAPEEPVPDKERYMTQSPKLTLTVVWNPSGFHVLAALPRRLKCHSGSYKTEILERINNWGKRQGAGSTRQLIVHADNATPHPAK
jgi:hypothetical protein